MSPIGSRSPGRTGSLLLRSFVALALAMALPSSVRLASAQEGDSLRIRVRYPAAGAAITATDSTFVFGQVLGAGPGSATVTVNGSPADVHEGGGWLAFVPVEPDSFGLRIVARAGGRSTSVDHSIVVPRPLFAPAPGTLPYKPETIEPRGPLEMYAGDTLEVGLVAAANLRIHARLDGEEVPLLPVGVTEVNRGRQVWGAVDPVDGAFSRKLRVEAASPAVRREAERSARGEAASRWMRYSGGVYLHLGAAPSDSLAIVIEQGEDEIVVPVASITYLDPTEVRVASLYEAAVAPAATPAGRTDGRVVARTGPGLGYELLLPNGTVVAPARRRGDWREIVLGPGQSAWVPLEDIHPVQGGPRSVEIAVVRTRRADGWSEIVLPLAGRLPFRLEQRVEPAGYAIEVYGLVSNVDWIETSIEDPLIESIRWSEPENGVFRLDVELTGDRAWGWHARHEGRHLVFGFRHPPEALADRRFRSPLHGVRVVVDPGHNPDPGAVGPTGLEEREANLGIALVLAEILETRGAQVVLTRATADSALGLYERTGIAIDSGGEIFVSIHNNALPDGVNPFVHNGTSVLYYHPQSQALAEAIQAELLPRTGLDDHGVWYQNLAVTRMYEMPAVLIECAFMMIPEQEALLRTSAYRREIAVGIADGIERYLVGAGGAGGDYFSRSTRR